MKKCVIKKIKFEDYNKHCLEATHLENKINQLQKKVDVDKKLRLKSQ